MTLPDHRAVYDAVAAAWDGARGASPGEVAWIDRAIQGLPPGAPVLDLGCGSGAPVALHLHDAGHRVTGVDFAPAMLHLARARLPRAEWIEADMRALSLGRRFMALIAWDSFFHLTRPEQAAMFPVFAAHLLPGGRLLFTSGTEEGEAWGQVAGHAVWHDSLSPLGYMQLLDQSGFRLRRFAAEDAETAGHTVWLAEYRP